jgi:hypothetical protein
MIQSWVYAQICDPAGSFLHSERESLERRLAVAEGGMDNAQLVREETLVAAHPLKVTRNLQCIAPLSSYSERMPETCQHHWAVRGAFHRPAQCRHGFRATAQTLERPSRKEVSPMETWLHADDAFGLGECLSEIPRHVVMPCDVRVHQRVEWVQFDNATARD